MSLKLQEIELILNTKATGTISNRLITELATDSRRVNFPDTAIYFAIKGKNHDGHRYIDECYKKGVKCFVCELLPQSEKYDDATFFVVNNSVFALQKIAAAHRNKFQIPIIGITGSNGKTIVKEWLNQLLSPVFQIIRSPKSYNSQIGVPLSVWNIETEHSLGIFEAGISEPGEMTALAEVIQPSIGIFTTLGEAHLENFPSKHELAKEKAKLFRFAQVVIYPKKQDIITDALHLIAPNAKHFTWSFEGDADVNISQVRFFEKKIFFDYHSSTYQGSVEIPFGDIASLENAVSALSACIYLQLDPNQFTNTFKKLHPVELRMQIVVGSNNSVIINDAYSSDIHSLEIALDYMERHSKGKPTLVILSDIVQSGWSPEKLHEKINQLLVNKKTERIFGIGPSFIDYQNKYQVPGKFFANTEELLKEIKPNEYSGKMILVKGARDFRFERVVNLFREKSHETVLEVDLAAIAHNMHFFKRKIGPSTKLMVMVKAGGYGTGSAEIAKTLEFNKADYLAVAYIDEGIALREAGVSLPIMVLNSELSGMTAMVQNKLEPEIFSFDSLNALLQTLDDMQHPGLYPVHIKLDTGMHRLGFEAEDIETLCSELKQQRRLHVVSIFTHLAAADAPQHDDFTQEQISLFEKMSAQIAQTLGYQPLLHAANTGAIQRHPNARFDMVRLGIGLYGISTISEEQSSLRTVATLKTTISQIKEIRKGESIGYNRAYIASRDMTIATIPVGYADGLRRILSNEKGSVWVNGSVCNIVGNVCMDMTMIDISNANAKEHDEVIVFGAQHDISIIAANSGTIPYEILTSISHRVNRRYIEE
jgi:alanine racemase